jgi:glycosyltransferase involved in cell wall biosynthesis
MNILLLSYGVPYPPDSGPRVKSYQLLRHLASRHKVTLACLAPDDTAAARAAALNPFCSEICIVPAKLTRRRRITARLGSLFGGRPALLAHADSPSMRDVLQRLLADAAAAGSPFDLVHVDQIQMAQFAEDLPLPRLLDAHNAVYQIYEGMASHGGPLRRWHTRREAAQLRLYEGRICAQFEAVTTVSEEDRDALLAAAGVQGQVSVIPIGVDGKALPPVPRQPQARGVLSLAAPGWPPNAEGIAWFAREVFPLVRRAVPDSRLSICGANPTAELRMLGERQPGVEVTGFVDPRPYLDQAAVAIAPLRSRGGMRVALLETLARGIPVVATSLACVGLGLVPGEDLLVADSPSDFADAVALLLGDRELGERLGAAGRRTALQYHDWRALTPAIDLVYAQMTARRAPHTEQSATVHPAVLS